MQLYSLLWWWEYLCPPTGGGHIILAFSAVWRPTWFQFLSYLYQVWHAGLLG